MSAPIFDEVRSGRIERNRTLRADEIFEVVRRDGEEEIARPAGSLAWSGIAAGLAIGFSIVAEAAIRARLGQSEGWAGIVGDAGYTVGFILVIVGKMQLFTENTITPVMPFCFAPTLSKLMGLLRIWGIVLTANVVGAVLFALFLMQSGAVSEALQSEVLALGRHAAHGGPIETIARGIGAGFLIAALVWLLAGQRGSTVLLIFIVTYVVALAGFAHVVAGTVEMAALVLAGTMSLDTAIFGFLIPALVGNVIGGTVLFTLIAYGQIRREVTESEVMER